MQKHKCIEYNICLIATSRYHILLYYNYYYFVKKEILQLLLSFKNLSCIIKV